MASVNEQNNEGVAEADKQASPPIQHGETHSRSMTHTPKGAAMTIIEACPAVPNQPSEGIKCPSPTLAIPKKDGTSREITMKVEGLLPPTFDSTGEQVTGAETNKLRLQNRRRRHTLQDEQDQTSMWTMHTGQVVLPPKVELAKKYLNEMCPQGIGTSHPAGELLAEWAQLGCPTQTGQPWSKLEMWEAVDRGPHQSSHSPKALAHFKTKSKEKVAAGQA